MVPAQRSAQVVVDGTSGHQVVQFDRAEPDGAAAPTPVHAASALLDGRDGDMVRLAIQDAVLEAVGVGLVSVDGRGFIAGLNRLAEHLTGWSRDSAVARPIGEILQLVDGASREPLQVPLEHALQDGVPVELPGPVIMVAPDGREFRVECSLAAIKDRAGVTMGTAIVLRDVTEDRAAWEELRTGQRRLLEIAAQSGIVAWEVDESGLYTYVSEAAEDVWGYRPEDLVGRVHFFDLHPQAGRESFKTAALGVFDRRERLVQSESMVERSDGEVIWVSTTGWPVLGPGDCLRAYRGSDVDVTDHVRLRGTVETAERQVSAIADAAQDGIVMIDPQGCATYWNRSAERIFGYAAEEVIGKELHSLIAPGRYHMRHKPAFAEFVRNGTGAALGRTVDLQACHKDGTELDVELSLSSVELHDGWHAVGVVRDISEQVAARRRLEGRVRLIDFAAEHSSYELHLLGVEEVVRLTRSRIGGLYVRCPDGTSFRLNAQFALYGQEGAQTDVSLPRIAGARLEPFSSLVHTRTAIAHNQSLCIAGDGEKAVQLERGLLVPVVRNQKTVAVLVLGGKTGEYGDADSLTASFLSDVVWNLGQERIRAEELATSRERYMLAVDGSQDGIWDWSLADDRLFLSDSWKEMLGYAAHELPSEPASFFGHLHPEDRERVEACLARYLGREDSDYSVEFRLRHRAGHYIDVLARGKAIWDSEGKASRMAGSHTDISQMKSLQRQLYRHRDELESVVEERTAELLLQRDRAESASRAKTSFLSNMSHELRIPLNAVIGMAYLIRRAGLSARQCSQMKTLEAAGQHLLAIVNDILDLAKAEAGEMPLVSVDLDFSAILGRALAMFERDVQDKGLCLVGQYEQLPTDLVGDATRIEQALINYLGNAVKFTDSGTITARASVVTEDSDSALLRFEVEDTGVGIPEGFRGRLFRPFEQVEDCLTRRHGGTGLGLSITRRIAQLMGGEVGVDSVVGMGSTFWFTARLRRTLLRASVPEQEDGADMADALGMEAAGHRVLLVEDDPANMAVMQGLLEDVGIRAETARDGAEAVELANGRDYSLIIMDLQMPNMDGLQATRLIRCVPGHKETPILAFTANVLDESRRQCAEAGMDDFIPKPLVPESFYACLRVWLRSTGDETTALPMHSRVPGQVAPSADRILS